MTDKNKKFASYSSLKGFHRAIPIIMIALAVFLAFCFMVQDMGIFGNAISGLLLGLFSFGELFDEFGVFEDVFAVCFGCFLFVFE